MSKTSHTELVWLYVRILHLLVLVKSESSELLVIKGLVVCGLQVLAQVPQLSNPKELLFVLVGDTLRVVNTLWQIEEACFCTYKKSVIGFLTTVSTYSEAFSSQGG